MIGYWRISKCDFYRLGGFRNSALVRVTRGGRWAYFKEAS